MMSDMADGERRRYQLDRLLLCSVGLLLVVFSAVLFASTENGTILGFTFVGVFLLAFGAALPRIREAEVSTNKLALKMDPEQRAESVMLSLPGEVKDGQIDQPHELEIASRWYLGGEALARLLTPDQGAPLEAANLRLYLYDADRERLVPMLFAGEEAADDTAEEWEVGRGATGTAYARGDFVLVTGDAVWDATYGLSDSQSARFRHLTAVASMPVVNAAGSTIAVLTASTTAPGGGNLTSEDAFTDLVGRSLLIARVLVDLFGWFDDGYNGGDGERR